MVSRSSRDAEQVITAPAQTRVESRSSWPAWAVFIVLSGLGAGRGGQQVARSSQFTA